MMTRVVHLKSGPNLVLFKMCLVRTNQFFPRNVRLLYVRAPPCWNAVFRKGFGFYTQLAGTFSMVSQVQHRQTLTSVSTFTDKVLGLICLSPHRFTLGCKHSSIFIFIQGTDIHEKSSDSLFSEIISTNSVNSSQLTMPDYVSFGGKSDIKKNKRAGW